MMRGHSLKLTADAVNPNRHLAHPRSHRSFYIWLYLSLALLSTTTVILSLLSECPTLLFYILELVINLAMM